VVLQRGNQLFDEIDALRGFCSVSHTKFVVLVCLVFRRLFAEEPPNRFSKGQFGSRTTCFSVGKPFPTEVLDLRAQFPQFRYAVNQFIRNVRFRLAQVTGFCSCHMSSVCQFNIYPGQPF
jgi:hypothetical protein